MRTRTKGRSCTGKQRFDSRAAAEKAIWSLVRAKKAAPRAMHAYQCGFCGGWHAGHTRRGRRRPR